MIGSKIAVILSVTGLAATAHACPETCEGATVEFVPAGEMTPAVYLLAEGGALMPVGAKSEAAHAEARAAKVATTARAKTAKGDPDKHNITIVNDEGSFSVTMKDGELVEVKQDGEAVPEQRIKRDGDNIRIVDEDGETLAEFHVTPGGGLMFGEGEGQWWTPEAAAFAAEADIEPRPMIGVTMDVIDETLAEQLDLDQDEVVLITGVTEGMPAEKAGLKRGDIVVKIDGVSPATEERLREAVVSRKKGDTLRLEVLRKGKPQEIEIEVDVVAPRLAMGFGATAPRAPGASGGAFQWRMSPEQRAEMEAWAREMAEQGRHAGQAAADQARLYAETVRGRVGDTRKVLEEVRERLTKEYEKLKLTDEDRAKLAEALERVTQSIREMDVTLDAPRLRLFGRGDFGPSEALITPAPPAPPSAAAPPSQSRSRTSPEVQERLDRMESQMNRMQELLEKLAEEKKNR